MADRGGVVNVIIKARDVASSVVGRFRRNLAGISRTAKDVAKGIVTWTAALVAATFALEKLAERGSKIIAVKRTFAKVTEDEAEALERLREASAGTIDDFALMSLHNQALALGSAKTTEEFAKQIEITRTLGRAQGIEATEALQKFTVGMARLSKLRLDDLGITLTQAEADQRYAELIGKSAAALTESEKKIAFRNEAMRQAEILVERLGTGELKGAEAADRFGTSLRNLRDRLAEVAAESPIVAGFFDQLTGIASDIIDLIGGEAETLIGGMGQLGRLMGDALAGGINQALAIAAMTLPGQLSAISAFFQANADLSLENIEASRQALANFAEAARIEAQARRDARKPAGGGAGGGVGGGGAGDVTGGIFSGFAGTDRELRELLRRLTETRNALREATLDASLATTEEAAKKAKEEVMELEMALASLEMLAARFGGEGVISGRVMRLPGIIGDPRALENERVARLQAFRGREVTLSRESQSSLIRQREKTRESVEANQEEMEKAARGMERAQAVTVSAMFGIAQAAIAGTDQVARSVVSMITQILQATTESSVLGAFIGGIGGLVGLAFGGGESVPVRVDDYGSRALDQMREVGGPLRITTIIEQDGVEVERIERELINRSARDETVRFGATIGMGS
jgi:hypothetical protein